MKKDWFWSNLGCLSYINSHTGLVQVNTAYRCTVNRYRFSDTHDKWNNKSIIQLFHTAVASKRAFNKVWFTLPSDFRIHICTTVLHQSLNQPPTEQVMFYIYIIRNHVYRILKQIPALDQPRSSCHRLFLKLPSLTSPPARLDYYSGSNQV